jgi:hypothetical protein
MVVVVAVVVCSSCSRVHSMCGIECKVFGVKIERGEWMPSQDVTAGARSKREWKRSASDG